MDDDGEYVFVMADPRRLKIFRGEDIGGSTDGRQSLAVSYLSNRDGMLLELAITEEIADKLVRKIKRWKKWLREEGYPRYDAETDR